MNLSPELWHQIDPLLSEALEMDEPTRASWLYALEQTHPQLIPFVRKILASHDRAERLRELETVPKLAPPPSSSAFSIGSRIGPFELLRPLGRGGMGEVWLARQADGRVEREVALKLPTVYGHGDVWRERFRRERDILASLVHPNIAQLYDAGVSEAAGSHGQPYLAMEYIEGESLTDFVAARRATIAERLKLFQQILAAVAHAHRHLVVHRDLKPANILVDRDGRVKLLDFGIAKLIDESSEEETRNLTRLSGRLMTMRYAAPEQVTAGEISTAIDVYALGVILHELLTGLSPYRAVREGKPFTEAALISAEAALPSSLAIPADAATARKLSSTKQLSTQLVGDLDAIILKALRKKPADRYATVEQFDDDIGRHHDHRPVKARAGTWRYLTGRFIIRNKLPLATATAVLVTMAIGLVMVEQQRRVAIAEKARAEKHFASVRKLANTFMFELQNEVAKLAGSLTAREMLLKTSLEYLDSLSKESSDDAGLRAELAAAYVKIARLQGLSGGSNLGQLDAATANYERAKSLYASLGREFENNLSVQRDHVQVFAELANSYAKQGDPRWQENSEAAVVLARRLAERKDAGVREKTYAASMISENAYFTFVMGRQTPALDNAFEAAISRLEIVLREYPNDPYARDNFAVAHQRYAAHLSWKNAGPQRMAKALEMNRKALAIYDALSKEFPDNIRYADNRANLGLSVSDSLAKSGKLAEANQLIERGIVFLRERLAGDAKNAHYRSSLINTLSFAIAYSVELQDYAAAIKRGREAQALFKDASPDMRKQFDTRLDMAEVASNLAQAMMAEAAKTASNAAQRAGQLKEACVLLAEVSDFLVDARKVKPEALNEDSIQKALNDLKQCQRRLATSRKG